MVALGAILTITSGCALHARAPEPDLPQRAPVRPAAERSELLVAMRLDYAQLTAIVEQLKVPEQRLGQKSAIASWSLRIQKRPGVRIRPNGDRLCFLVPFEGQGGVQMLGREVARRVRGKVEVCARPRLNPDAELSLRDPVVRVEVDQGRLALNSRVLSDKLKRFLTGGAAKRLIAGFTTIKIPLPRLLAPFMREFTGTLEVSGGAKKGMSKDSCLRPRAESLTLGQPRVEPDALRFAAVIRGRPTLESPCGTTSPSQGQRSTPKVQATLRITQRPSRMIIPMGLSTERARAAIMADLRRRGPIRWPKGEVVIKALRIDTSRGAVVVHATLNGHAQGSFLGFSTTRAIDGEVIVWGRPSVAHGRVGLADPKMSVALDDEVADLAAALRASELKAVIMRHLSMPVAGVMKDARRGIQRLGTSLRIGRVPLPARVKVEQLVVSGARVEPSRLVLETRFVGWIVFEPSTLRRGASPARSRSGSRTGPKRPGR